MALFIFLITTHVFLTWKALEFDWFYVQLAAIWPVLVLEAAGIRLDSCQGFICLPGPVGWTLSLAIWGGTHYLLAKLLGKWAMHEMRQA